MIVVLYSIDQPSDLQLISWKPPFGHKHEALAVGKSSPGHRADEIFTSPGWNSQSNPQKHYYVP